MTTPVKRSYHGCVRCKRRRQKCDEQKPNCRRCSDAGESCEYKILLKWNGRVPRKGKASPRDGGDVCTGVFDIRSNNANLSQNQPQSDQGWESTTPILSLDLQRPSPTLNKTTQLLLHHFITETSKISSSAHIRDQICQTILPMTHQSDSLRYATMAFAALHRYTLLNELPAQFMPEDHVASLIASSMRCLRRDLETPGYPIQPLLHTIRTLCHCEIFSGRANSSWRVHVNGAGAMFAEITSKRNMNESEYSFWLWSRWFWSIQALTATTDVGKLSEMASAEPLTLEYNQDYFFDTYTGYSSDLNIVLMEIGSLIHGNNGSENGADMGEADSLIEKRSVHLENSIKHMINRDMDLGLKFPDNALVDHNTSVQFQACNTAYQYSGLIHLYRRVRGLPSFSPEVQECVRAILDAVSGITPITTLSPWIVLTTPIFTAGCEAIGQDRKLVKELLQELYFTLHIRNIIRALEILEQRWESFDHSMNPLVGHEERPAGDYMQEVGSADWLDFIPY